MDRLTESKFGLEAVGRSSEFRIGMMLRRSGLLTLASWLKNGARDRLHVSVINADRPVTVQSIHSRVPDPSIPWMMIEYNRGARLSPCAIGAYGEVLMLQQGAIVRAQVASDPLLVFRRSASTGRISVRFNERTETIDVPPGEGLVVVCPGRTPMLHAGEEASPPVPQWTDFQRAFTDGARERGLEAVAVHTPRWLGVSNSTRALFSDCYPVPNTAEQAPADLTQADLEHHAEVLLQSGVKRVIFSGGDEAHHRLMHILRQRGAKMRFDLVFHGNFTQLQDPYVWKIFQLWADDARAGVLSTFVTMKQGAERVLQAAGVPSRCLLNYIPGEPHAPPEIAGEAKHIGIWFSGTAFKSAHPMLASLTLIPGAALHSAGLGPEGEALAKYLRLARAFHSDHAVPKEELHRRIRETHLSLYVTSAECSPMLPLESLQLGVPCLIGPCCHLFEDHPYLHERLVVAYPDRPEVIAGCALRAIEERGQIIAAWREYAPRYNARAESLVREFLASA